MKSKEFLFNIVEYAEKYIDFCIMSTKEIATGKGIQVIKERHIPTIEYFLRIWLPRNLGETIDKATYYRWLKENEKCDSIKKIDDEFKALASDIVANEQKGIFYAKNKLGWSDSQKTDVTTNGKDINNVHFIVSKNETIEEIKKLLKDE